MDLKLESTKITNDNLKVIEIKELIKARASKSYNTNAKKKKYRLLHRKKKKKGERIKRGLKRDETFIDKKTKDENQKAHCNALSWRYQSLRISRQSDGCTHQTY